MAEERKKYSAEAKTRVAAVRKELAVALEYVAAALTKGDGLEVAQEQHIIRARQAIVSGDSIARPFYKRREFLVGVGTMIFGSSLSFASIAYHYNECGTGGFWVWVVGVPAAMLVIGVFLAVLGWR